MHTRLSVFLLFTGTAFANININAITNAADGQWNRLVPGEIISLYGKNLGPESGQSFNGSLPLPRTLAGVSVLIGGHASSLYFVSIGQINAQVPKRESMRVEKNGTVSVQVCRAELGCSNVLTPWLVLAAPGVFSYTDLNGRSNKIVQGFTRFAGNDSVYLITSERPAERSDDRAYYLLFWGTGFGGHPKLKDGEAAPGSKPGETPVQIATNLSITVAVRRSDNAIEFLSDPLHPNVAIYAAPGFAGLDQINVKLPGNLPPGEHKLEVYIGGGTSAFSAIIFTR